MNYTYTDGGRSEAGYKGEASDCVARAYTILSGLTYKEVYEDLARFMQMMGKPKSARNAISEDLTKIYYELKGLKFVAAKRVGKQSNIHLNKAELPTGRIIVSIDYHVCTVIDRVIHDNYDWSDGGEEPVTGYWTL